MKLFFAIIVFVCAAGMGAAAAPLEFAPGVSNQINVTNGDWVPSAEQRQNVLRAVAAFLAARDNGRYADAYAMYSESMKRRLTPAQFAEGQKKFAAAVGKAKTWKIIKITWTKDPPPAQAPRPGVYAAVDLTAQFDNADRYCGYMILYQPPEGGDFVVARVEHNFLDNASAGAASKQEADRIWAQLSGSCPNYVPSGR